MCLTIQRPETEVFKSPFEKGGFRGISGDYIKSPPSPLFQRGVIIPPLRSFGGFKMNSEVGFEMTPIPDTGGIGVSPVPLPANSPVMVRL
jgi:hypothetical protein